MTPEQLQKLKSTSPWGYNRLMESAKVNGLNIESMTPMECFDAILEWEGIIGYLRQIVDTMHGLNL